MPSDVLVWITGASAGIGAALAAAVPFDEPHVVDISRSGATPGTEHLPADLADPAAWAAVEAHLLARLASFSGQRAVFVHAAGTLDPIGFAGEVDSAAYRRQVLLNAAAPLALGNAFLTALHESPFSGGADLVLLTSGAARSVYPGWSAYGGGKAAVDHWVRTVGAEQAARDGGCRVLAVSPGPVATAMQELIRGTDARAFPEVARFRSLYARGQLLSPADAADGIWQLVVGGVEGGTVTDLRTRRPGGTS